MAMRKLDGYFPYDDNEEDRSRVIYAWLNPNLSIEEQYAPERLLGSYIETNEAAFWYFLEVLPPLFHLRDGFAVGECVTGDIYLAFFRIAGRFFAAHIECGSPHNTTFYNVRNQIALDSGNWKDR